MNAGPRSTARRARGFSLVELTVVIAIVGLLLGALLVPLTTQVEQRKRRDTEAMMAEIREALYAFAMVNGRLPCPDCATGTAPCNAVPAPSRNDGQEDLVTGNVCAYRNGNIPWVTLGVPAEDAWGQRFVYNIEVGFANIGPTAASGTCPATTISFSLCAPTGDIAVRDAATGGALVANQIPALVLSRGANYAETPSADEAENLDEDSAFVTRGYSADFDDLVVWLSPYVLKDRMVKAARLP